jgi:hypothetical protein
MAVENDVLMRLGAEEASSLRSAWGGMENSMSGLMGMATTWGSRLLGVGAVLGGVSYALSTATQEYIQYAEAVRHLNTALDGVIKQNAVLMPVAAGIKGVFLDSANAMSRVSTASDEQIMALQRTALNYGILTGRVNETVQAALNFAAATGTDVNTAMMRLAQASNGVYMGWKKWGIEIDDSKTKLENFDAILAQLNVRFGGAARAEMDSYAGAVSNVSKAWSDFWKAHGDLPADDWKTAKNAIASILRALTPKEKGPTGPELFAQDQARLAMQEQEAAAKAAEQAEIARANAKKQRHKDAESFAAFAKRMAEDEKARLQGLVQTQKELKQAEDARWKQAQAQHSTLAREYADQTVQERARAKRIYETVEKEGTAGWEGMTKSQRDWYSKTQLGRGQLERKGIYEEQADRGANWLRSAAGSTKVQVEAAVKNEIIVSLRDTDPMLAKSIADKAYDAIVEYLSGRKTELENSIRFNSGKEAAYVAAAAATGGGK